MKEKQKKETRGEAEGNENTEATESVCTRMKRRYLGREDMKEG